MSDNGVEISSVGFEEIPCPLCGTGAYTLSHHVRDRLNTGTIRTENGPQDLAYQIVACSTCGFLYLNPRPKPGELHRFYRAESYDSHRGSGGGFLGILFRTARLFAIRWKAKKVSADLSPGSLLDVGCGRGDFLAFMKTQGWAVTGIERDEGAAGAAKSTGTTVLIGDPADVALREEDYDLITIWHALEHFPHLVLALDKILAALKRGGRLALAVPNPGSFDARHYRERWAAWDAPRHLYHFRPVDIQKLLQPYSLQWVHEYAMPLDPFYHALLSEISWNPGITGIFRALRGLVIGTFSFFGARDPRKASSVLYLFAKE